jgi:hypothetical protein
MESLNLHLKGTKERLQLFKEKILLSKLLSFNSVPNFRLMKPFETPGQIQITFWELGGRGWNG